MVSHAHIHQAEASRRGLRYNWGLHVSLKEQPTGEEKEKKEEYFRYNHSSTDPRGATVLQTALQAVEKLLSNLRGKR